MYCVYVCLLLQTPNLNQMINFYLIGFYEEKRKNFLCICLSVFDWESLS